jgi:HTH-type transcriptional regulator/antitoxin HigA
MIKNNKQLEITKRRIADFETTLEELSSIVSEQIEDVVFHKAQLSAIRNTIQELAKEVSAYESLREGQLCAVLGGVFDELPRILIQARIAKGWTQTRLAEEIGIDTQQIQKYESNDYEAVGLVRLYEIVDALEISLSFDRTLVSKDNVERNETAKFIQQKVIDRGQLFQMQA